MCILLDYPFQSIAFTENQNNRIAVITGALLYAFSMYILVMGFHHPFFINPLIYFPLLLIGIEKNFGRKIPDIFYFNGIYMHNK